MRSRGGSGEELFLRRWRLRNFKSVEDQELSFGPLNVLVGSNSSGKSSLLQSIVLWVQAAQAQSSGLPFPLNGPLMRLGNFDDVVHADAIEEGATLGIGGEFGISFPRGFRARPETAQSTFRGAQVKVLWEVDLGKEQTSEELGSAGVRSVRWSVEAADEERSSVEISTVITPTGIVSGETEAAHRSILGRAGEPIPAEDRIWIGTNSRSIELVSLEAGVPVDVLVEQSVTE